LYQQRNKQTQKTKKMKNSKEQLIKIAKLEILKTKNLCCEYLNNFLNDYALSSETGAFLHVNFDACQYQAKLELLNKNILEYSNDSKNTNFKFA
jgi:hypothetical protein